MLVTRCLLVPVLAVLLVPGGGPEPLTFSPAAGTTLQRDCSWSHTLELESLSVQFNGEDVPAEYLEAAEGSMSREETIVVTDVLETMGDGRPERLVRTFDELSARETLAFGGEPSEEIGASELEGKRVVFRWNAESDAHEAEWAEGEEGDEALLAELEEDMDLRALLPGRAVEPDERWEIEVEVFDRLLSPGGDLALVSPSDEEDEDDDSDQQFRENIDGSFVARYVGSSEEDGTRVGVIAVTIEARTFAEQPLGEDERPEGFEGTRRVEMEVELEGELHWDLEHGHARLFELSGTMALDMLQALRGEVEGESHEQSQRMEFAGPVSLRFTIERP